MKNSPRSRKANLVVQEMDDEILIYDLNSNKAFCLNQTSALVWQLSNGKRTTAEISELISKQLETNAGEDLIWFALDQLKKEKLIENEAELDNYFAGMSRREVIRKVGMGTMVALPIIAGVVAPIAAEAQTCIAPINRTFGMACDQNCQCQSNCCGVVMTCGVSGLAMNFPCTANCNCASGNCATMVIAMIPVMLCA